MNNAKLPPFHEFRAAGRPAGDGFMRVHQCCCALQRCGTSSPRSPPPPAASSILFVVAVFLWNRKKTRVCGNTPRVKRQPAMPACVSFGSHPTNRKPAMLAGPSGQVDVTASPTFPPPPASPPQHLSTTASLYHSISAPQHLRHSISPPQHASCARDTMRRRAHMFESDATRYSLSAATRCS